MKEQKNARKKNQRNVRMKERSCLYSEKCLLCLRQLPLIRKIKNTSRKIHQVEQIHSNTKHLFMLLLPFSTGENGLYANILTY